MEELTKDLNIENMIYEIRGKQVMLDSDFEKLETKEQVNEMFFEGQIYDVYSKIIDNQLE